MKKIKLMKKNPVWTTVENSIMSLPTPTSISFMWNMGFLLGMTLILQTVTGLVLAMSYTPEISLAFESVIHIMRDMETGWMMRYYHLNGASLFFFLLYMHMARGIYFNSTKKMPLVWASGLLILLVTMGTAFLGYVLPWGQMSFWGATVITSMLTTVPYVGKTMTEWLWGNFAVSQPTLNRFLALHFILPMILFALVMIHLMMLHESGSSNPTGINSDKDKMKFFPYFATKDLKPVMYIMFMMSMIMSNTPNLLGDVENFNKASMSSTPSHIQPEWYFLFAYAILRAIPSKLGGVVAMILSILVLYVMTMKKEQLNKKFSPTKKFTYWLFMMSVMMLTWVGANPVEEPYVQISQAAACLYFMLVINL